MKALDSAISELAGFLEANGIPYMVIGGMANSVWGEARSTIDVDVSIWAEGADSDSITERLIAKFTPRSKHSKEFLDRTRVLVLKNSQGVELDVLYALLPYEKEAIERAVPITIQGKPVRFCTAEDLILHKILSERPKDREDVRGVLRRRGAELDYGYLDPRVRGIAEMLERSEISEFWEDLKRSKGTGGRQ